MSEFKNHWSNEKPEQLTKIEKYMKKQNIILKMLKRLKPHLVKDMF